ncbi:universal stress protein [uncultured Cohaesibacter sp.]|uniref:universal stress protein n=1 Tax=uncultured Cohaesibacter sp. TaxID=1002546 RepID=UPI002AA8C46A|nr:universal stress protein [uncultured Cohaesibacter sp.]
MFNTIMVPVDLRHTSKLEKTLTIAADMARTNEAAVIFVGVTGPEPGDLGHTSAEFGDRLQAFASAQMQARGINATAHVIVANDPAVDLNKKLMEAVEATGSDLVIMASHIPNISDYIWSSHGGHLASHSRASVFLVRG